MTYVISEECVSCGACVSECPNNAISEGADKYVIDPDACVDCGTCADVCPNNAISPA
jgi:ferredoxin